MEYLVFVGMILALFGSASYIKEMLKGKVKPNRISWLMWSVAPLIATAAAISEGVTLAVIPVFAAGLGPLIVLVVSLFKKDAYWKITKLDYGCGILSLLALILWYITKDPIVAIIFSIASDGLASIPTLLKSWKHPETEDSIAYFTGLLSACTSFAAVSGEWSFATIAYPVYLIIATGLTTIFIERKRISKIITPIMHHPN